MGWAELIKKDFLYETVYKDKLGAKQLTEIFDNFSDGIFITDREGKIVIYNKAKEIQENRDRNDMVGKYTWEAYGYSGIEGSEHAEVFRTGVPVINKYYAHSIVDDIPRYISYSTYPLEFEGEQVGVYSISKSEDSLHKLLMETLEEKRQFNANIDMRTNRKYSENGTSYSFSDIVGNSPAMNQLIKEAQNISWLDNAILIVGETGSGKEVLSQSIHNYGKRSKEPFIGVNCSAIPDNLLESMMFGTVKGAFTGAMDTAGLFEEAKEGTLFLDEINTMPLSMQAKLLRVLQEKRVRRLGSTKHYDIECRIIAATNEDPTELIKSGRMREDLYYRISGFLLRIPPLKERREDIIVLVDHFIKRYGALMGKAAIGVDSILKKVLDSYHWSGNIRELENLVENMLVNSDNESKYLTVDNIPSYLRSRFITGELPKLRDLRPYNEIIADLEKNLITSSLNENSWNVSQTARELGLNRHSLLNKIKRLNIQNSDV